MAIRAISCCMCDVGAMGRGPPNDFTKASVFVLTKHARKITMHITSEKASLHALSIRQLFDAHSSLIRRATGARTGQTL